MKVLFVTPNTSGTGEAITALGMARAVVREGGSVDILASEATAGLFGSDFAGRVHPLAADASANLSAWRRLLRLERPQAVVFADYPLLAFTAQGKEFAGGGWQEELDRLGAVAATLDHLGLARGPMTIFFGPPHLGIYPLEVPVLPPGMEVLLPCPVQAPRARTDSPGRPFRVWDLPLGLDPDARRRAREELLEGDDELLIFHSAPSWAVEFARDHRLPNYWYLTNLLEHYLEGLQRPVRLVSVNDGGLLAPARGSGMRVTNLSPLLPRRYEALLFASDLMLTDNRVSASLGKAVCAGVPAVALRNSFSLAELMQRADRPLRRLLLEMEAARMGAVFPFEVFPIWDAETVEKLGVFRDNSFTDAIATLEAYGGEDTGTALRSLLVDRLARDRLHRRQARYTEEVARLPGAAAALRGLIDGDRAATTS